jgi:hypothetical protein
MLMKLFAMIFNQQAPWRQAKAIMDFRNGRFNGWFQERS